LRLNREGHLDKMQEAKELHVMSRLDQGTATQTSLSNTFSELRARLRRKDTKS